jgi:uncharacterized membrane protein YbhN (UPF0104 family)
MSVKSRRRLSLSAAVVATLVIGYFVFSRLNWHDLVTLQASSDWRFVALGFAAYLCANLMRAARFRSLTGDQIPTGLMLRTVIVQNLLNTFLPLRAGEASYLYMVHRTGTVKPSDNVSSLLGARLLDLLAALCIPILALPFSRASATHSGVPLAWLAALPVLGVAGLVLGLHKAEVLARLISARANTPRQWLNRGLLFGSDILRSFAQLRHANVLGRVTMLTMGCWLFAYFSGYLSLLGVGLKVPFFDGVFAYGFPVIVSMMPFFMLGGFGVYEGTIGIGLSLIGVPLGLATAAGVALHVLELLFVLVPGPLTLVPRLWSRRAPTDR